MSAELDSDMGFQHLFIAAAIAGACASAHAQTVSAVPLSPTQVAQFGMPGHAQFVFCRADVCPRRTVKTLAVSQADPVTSSVAIQERVLPQAATSTQLGEVRPRAGETVRTRLPTCEPP